MTMNTEQERAELLPCPFCGESKNLTVQHCEGTIIHPAYRIYCGNCGASNGYSDRVDPVKNWNSRAALQSQDKEDAERYRSLRKGDIDDVAVVRGLGAMDYGASAVIATYSVEIDGDDLDAAIDHARRVEEKT